MPIAIGPTIEDGLYYPPSYYYEQDDGDVGSTVGGYSTQGLGQASVETEAVAPPKFGPSVSEFDMDILLEIFGELL